MTPLVGLSTVNIYQVHRAVDLKVEADILTHLTSQYLTFHQEVLLKQLASQLVVGQEVVVEKEGCTKLQYQLHQETTVMKFEGHVIEKRRKRECKRELTSIFSQLKRKAREDRYVTNNVCSYTCNSSSFSSVLHERYSLHGYKPGHDHTDRTIDILL